MKSISAILVALTLTVSGVARANETQVQIPGEVSATEALANAAQELLAVQLTELAVLETQQKFYQILLSTITSSYESAKVFESQEALFAQPGTAAGTVGGGVALAFADVRLAKMWLSGAAPTAAIVKDLWFAARGQESKLSAIGSKSWGSIKAMFNSLKVPKNFVTTAALGTFAYIQVDTFIVVNMSEAQYQAEVMNLEAKIVSIQARQAAIADMRATVQIR